MLSSVIASDASVIWYTSFCGSMRCLRILMRNDSLMISCRVTLLREDKGLYICVGVVAASLKIFNYRIKTPKIQYKVML